MKAQKENDLTNWLSTYGMITADRILGKYQVHLSPEELKEALISPHSFYHRLLILPLKNVFNGIILSQASDYQVYAQKLFIDYLMSGESDRSAESPGAHTRETLENERQALLKLSDDFHECELDHGKLIALAQKSLMKSAHEWEKLLAQSVQQIAFEANFSNDIKPLLARTIRSLVIEPELVVDKKISIKEEAWVDIEKKLGQSLSQEAKEVFTVEIIKLLENSPNLETSLTNYGQKIDEMGARIRKWRTDFHDFILHVNELLQLLPEYHANKAKMEENQEALHFDASIGKND